MNFKEGFRKHLSRGLQPRTRGALDKLKQPPGFETLSVCSPTDTHMSLEALGSLSFFDSRTETNRPMDGQHE
jgi:hypothetical protein